MFCCKPYAFISFSPVFYLIHEILSSEITYLKVTFLCTHYFSGEAYELPDTRMELREPALEVIEECIQPLGTFANSDQDIFRMPVINMGKILIITLQTF